MGNLGVLTRKNVWNKKDNISGSAASIIVFPVLLISVHLCFVAGFQPLLLEPLLKFHHTLRKLGLKEEEYVLMQAMSLFSPGSRKSLSVHPSPC